MVPKAEDSLGKKRQVETQEVQTERRRIVNSHSESCKTKSWECSGWSFSQGLSKAVTKLYTSKSQSESHH